MEISRTQAIAFRSPIFDVVPIPLAKYHSLFLEAIRKTMELWSIDSGRSLPLHKNE
jgi:hypothetical protein